MSRANIQIPVTTAVKQQSIKTAMDLGFASVQDMIRFLLSQLNSKKFDIGVLTKKDQNIEYLTDKQVKYLDNRLKEIKEEEKKGELFKASSADEMMDILMNTKIN